MLRIISSDGSLLTLNVVYMQCLKLHCRSDQWAWQSLFQLLELCIDGVDFCLPIVAMNSTATLSALIDARFIRLVDDHVGSPPARSDTPRKTITGTPGDVAVC
jgi:hypothetical protein